MMRDKMDSGKAGISALRTALLAGVAATALMAVAPGDAKAEASEPNRGMFGVIEGGYVFGAGDSQTWAENTFTGEAPEVGPSDAFRGRFGFGGYISHDTSLAVYISGLSGQEENDFAYSSIAYLYNVLGGAYSTFYFTGMAELEQDLIVVDFEARHDVGLGGESGFDLSVSGGLRFVDFSQQTNTTFIFSPFFTLRERHRAEFKGLGPRVGVHGRVPVGDNISIGADVNGAYLFGRQEVRETTRGGLFFVGSNTRRDDATSVLNLDGAVDATYDIPDSSVSVTLGYHLEAFFGVLDSRTAVSVLGNRYGSDDDDLIYHGPFIRVTVNF